MDWQLLAAAGAVAGAAGYVVRAAWRTWFGPGGSAGCGSGCGKCAGAATASEPAAGRRIALPVAK